MFMVLTAAYLIYSILFWGKTPSAGVDSAEWVGVGLVMMFAPFTKLESKLWARLTAESVESAY